MEFLESNQILILVIGLLVTVSLVFVYAQTKEKRLLPFLFVAAIIALLPIVLDALITTNKEQLQLTVKRLARTVQLNDVNGAAKFVHPDHDNVRNRILNEMPTYRFALCNVTGFRSIEITNDTAEVTFTVFVNVSAPRHNHEGMAPRAITLNMKKDIDDEWKITNYRHFHPSARKKVFADP